MARVMWTMPAAVVVLMLDVAPTLADIPGLNTHQEQKFLVMLAILALLVAGWLLWRKHRGQANRTI